MTDEPESRKVEQAMPLTHHLTGSFDLGNMDDASKLITRIASGENCLLEVTMLYADKARLTVANAEIEQRRKDILRMSQAAAEAKIAGEPARNCHVCGTTNVSAFDVEQCMQPTCPMYLGEPETTQNLRGPLGQPKTAAGGPGDRTDEVLALRAALRNMADAYVRKVKTSLSEADIAKEPWRCMEYIEAERLCKTAFKLRFTREWLRKKIMSDPDDAPCEIGPAPPEPGVGAKELRLVRVLNHIYHEVSSLEDFDADSLRKEIEQALAGEKEFDDNKALRAEIDRLTTFSTQAGERRTAGTYECCKKCDKPVELTHGCKISRCPIIRTPAPSVEQEGSGA